jgi:hypothetical protein
MTQKDKELLLKDLCARIPYGVKGIIKGGDVVTTPLKWYAEQALEFSIGYMVVKNGWRPYLFPLSSMTEEQKEEWRGIRWSKLPWEELDWLNKGHWDYMHLIEKGLAIDATGLNIY